MAQQAHEIPIAELAHQHNTSLEAGLTNGQASDRLKHDGLNELTKPPKPTLLMLFIMQLTGFVIILLLVAGGASLLVNATGPNKEDILSYTTGKAIFVIVLINAAVAAWSEHKAGDALEALSRMTQASIHVLRDGLLTKVDTTNIVRGDLVILGTGDVVPADIRLVEAQDLKVTEMALTGEPDDVPKSLKAKTKKEGEAEKLTPENMIFSGCSITNGNGKGLVLETGMSTRIGKIAQMIAGNGEGMKKKCFCLPDTSASATPLQTSLEKLGARIGLLAIVVCVIIFVVGTAMQREDPQNPDSPDWLYMILVAVTLAVAAIPEGIPLCVTISLSLGCKEMVKKNVLVCKLAAVETLGAASVICSDKTGTLTEGKMTMVNMWSGGIEYDVSGKGFDPTVGEVQRSATGANANQDLGVRSALMSALLCCNTTLHEVKDPETGDMKWEPQGNSSEAPLVVAAKKIGLADLTNEHRRILEVPFSSSRKMMLTVTDMQGRDAVCSGGMPFPPGANFLTVCKGAPNYILDLCREQLMEDGTSQSMTGAMKDHVLKMVDYYSAKALRVLAIAACPMAKLPFDVADEDTSMDSKFELCREGLMLVGLVASIDPDREGVKESVALARDAGIKVVMITGDYLKTAVAIAHNVRILQIGDDEATSAVDCARLRPDGTYLNDAQMDALTSSVHVFARAKPEDKLEIVKSLQRQRAVTAMTGDGVNDAPALNQADIGVAMGIQGTEVAKGAADMILQDDNFCSIVAAVEKGRAIYAGIQKFVAFIMSVHIAEVIQICSCIVAGFPLMRTPLQILFLILVTDLPPSIALGMEPGDKSILKQRPRSKDDPIVPMWMWLSIAINATVLSVVIVAIYIAALSYYCDGEIFQEHIMGLGAEHEDQLKNAQTVAFIALVFSENVRSYTSRSFDQPIWKNVFGNKYMQQAVVLAQLCLLGAVFIPVLSTEVLGLRGIAIGWEGWLLALAGPVCTLLLCEACKVITAFQMRQHEATIAHSPQQLMGKVTSDVSSVQEQSIVKVGEQAGTEIVRNVSGDIRAVLDHIEDATMTAGTTLARTISSNSYTTFASV